MINKLGDIYSEVESDPSPTWKESYFWVPGIEWKPDLDLNQTDGEYDKTGFSTMTGIVTEFWDHYCYQEGCEMRVEKNCECNWCGEKEKK